MGNSALDKSINHWAVNLELANRKTIELTDIGSNSCPLCDRHGRMCWNFGWCPLVNMGMFCSGFRDSPWNVVAHQLNLKPRRNWKQIVAAVEVMYMCLLFVREAENE